MSVYAISKSFFKKFTTDKKPLKEFHKNLEFHQSEKYKTHNSWGPYIKLALAQTLLIQL